VAQSSRIRSAGEVCFGSDPTDLLILDDRCRRNLAVQTRPGEGPESTHGSHSLVLTAMAADAPFGDLRASAAERGRAARFNAKRACSFGCRRSHTIDGRLGDAVPPVPADDDERFAAPIVQYQGCGVGLGDPLPERFEPGS
jgi:hypothetical protein